MHTAIREFRNRPNPESEYAEEDVYHWRVSIELCLQSAVDVETAVEVREKQPTYQRMATFDLACAIERQFTVCVGHGVKLF